MSRLATRCEPFIRSRCSGDYWTIATLYPEYCLGAVVDDEMLVAMALGLPHAGKGHLDQLYIQDVAVDPDHRRDGIATRLLDAIAGFAEMRGVSRIWLTTDPANREALALWGELGFTNVQAEQREAGYWVVRDLKGEGCHRALFETTPSRLRRAMTRRMGERHAALLA